MLCHPVCIIMYSYVLCIYFKNNCHICMLCILDQLVGKFDGSIVLAPLASIRKEQRNKITITNKYISNDFLWGLWCLLRSHGRNRSEKSV